jgi:hypothetical protein
MRAKPIVWIAVALVALLAVRMLVGRMNAPDDQQQIQQALADSIKASKEGRPGGVMDKLSSNLKLNDMETSANRGQIAQYIRDNKPDVRVLQTRAVITGDQAQIVSPVELEVNILGQRLRKEIDNVTLIFKKEDDREYLVFPTRKWKLFEVRMPPDAVQQFMQ